MKGKKTEPTRISHLKNKNERLGSMYFGFIFKFIVVSIEFLFKRGIS